MTSSHLRHSLWKQAQVLLFGMILYVPALAIAFLDTSYFLTPELVWLQGALILGWGLNFFLWFYVLLAKVFPLWAEQGRKRWTYFALSLLGQALLVMILGAFLITLDLKIFEPQYQRQSAKSPDGRQVAYLYSQGLFCGFKVYTRPEWHWALTEKYSVERDCEALGRPRISWSPDSSAVGLVDDEGKEFSKNAKPLDLYLGPH